MAIALNMTVPLKQDAESQQKLQGLIAGFADQVHPAIDRSLSSAKAILLGPQQLPVSFAWAKLGFPGRGR